VSTQGQNFRTDMSDKFENAMKVSYTLHDNNLEQLFTSVLPYLPLFMIFCRLLVSSLRSRKMNALLSSKRTIRKNTQLRHVFSFKSFIGFSLQLHYIYM
jgi:hypothetical protein